MEATLSEAEGRAYRLAESCMREEKRLRREFSPSVVRWIFKACGLWEALKTLSDHIKAAERTVS